MHSIHFRNKSKQALQYLTFSTSTYDYYIELFLLPPFTKSAILFVNNNTKPNFNTIFLKNYLLKILKVTTHRVPITTTGQTGVRKWLVDINIGN